MHNYGYFEKDQIGTIKDVGLWRRILRYSYPYRFGLAGAVLLSLCIMVTSLWLPRFMQQGIDGFITQNSMPMPDRVDGLGEIAILYGACVVFLFFSGFLQVVVLEWIGQSIMHSLRQELFSHLLRLDLAFFNRQPAGRLVTRVTNDITNMHEMFTSVMVTLFNDFLKILGILCLLYIMNVKLALLMTLFLPLSVWITIIFSKLAREKFRAIRTQLARLNAFLQEAVSGISVIQIFGRERESHHKFKKLSREFRTRTFSQIKLFGTFMPLTEFMGSAAVAMILWYGGGEIIEKRLTLGEFVAFLSYMRLFFQPMRELSQKYSIVQSALASAERIFLLLDSKSKIHAPESAVPIQSVRGNISFHNVSFGYEKDVPVLHDINLEIREGETVAIVGATGSGKSSLINLLVRFYDPWNGYILLDGTRLSSFDPIALKKKISIIQQEVVIMPDTILKNITVDTQRKRSELAGLLGGIGVDGFIGQLPQELDTIIGEGGRDLSAGEKQLLSIARALCRDPMILILDEATSSIDPETESVVAAALSKIFKTKTSLIVAHRLSTVKRADRIVVMDQGRIVEEGPHDSLMVQQGYYYQLVTLDQHFVSAGFKRNISI